jgi:hypothetical protein
MRTNQHIFLILQKSYLFMYWRILEDDCFSFLRIYIQRNSYKFTTLTSKEEIRNLFIDKY